MPYMSSVFFGTNEFMTADPRGLLLRFIFIPTADTPDDRGLCIKKPSPNGEGLRTVDQDLPIPLK